jgi:hypothetical protein
MADETSLNVPISLDGEYENARELVDQLGIPTPRHGNPAAEWRLRIKRQRAIDERLHKMGPLAALSGSSLLVLLEGTQVKKLERSSNWRSTLEESTLYQTLDPVKQGQLKGARSEPYRRIEESIQLLGEMICLVVSDLRDFSLLSAFNTFKIRCASFAFASDSTNDQTVEKIKWLGKACQAVLLGSKIPEEPESKLSFWEGDRLLPFVGELAYISDAIRIGRRQHSLTHLQATQLAQIGNLPRSLPYPSKGQVIQSVKETVAIVQNKVETPEEALKLYRRGLDAMMANIRPLGHKTSHVSLVGSGTVENSRSEGGRARFLVAHARETTDLPLSEGKDLVGKYDQFGLILIDKMTYEIALELAQKNSWDIRLGNVLYVPPFELETVLTNCFVNDRKIPKYLGHILNLTASKLVRGIGRFEPEPMIIANTIAFTSNKCQFKLERKLYVKADVSVESGLKTRLTTSCLAAVAHLGQLPANFMRETLSQDPFHRVGFEESDKLWEVLKYYRKSVSKNTV